MIPIVHSRRMLLLVVTCAVLLASVATLPTNPLAQAQGPQDGALTLQMIQETDIPPRDRIDLARRLLGVTDIPVPPTSAPEREVGHRRTFWVDNIDADYEFQVEAELLYKTDHIYMYVAVDALSAVRLDALKRSADIFETQIRPRVHEVFGTEWVPGIDGDPHIIILHARDMGSWVAAYYGSSSQLPVEAVSSSNEAEMFFVNMDTMDWAIGTPYYESVLAHEFQHMVQWVVDGNEDTWLNEGLSELAAMLTGYGASGFADQYISAPGIQLNSWPENGSRGLYYGGAFLFVTYIYERFGEDAIKSLVRDPENGLTSVASMLAEIGATDPLTGEPVDVVDLFADWVVTNVVMDATVGDGRYVYVEPELATMGRAVVSQGLRLDGVLRTWTAPQWGPLYLHIPGGAEAQTVRLAFSGQETVGVVDTDAHSGRYAWWSNRGDESDMRLTHVFDLSDVASATLNFWTWYHIENLWDYAYVMVSVDGGATWTPLATEHTTTEDPHSNGYGPGYTGLSNGWVQESADLTPYAGGEVLVRFEYITDDATTQPGMLIDDVSIPEIGYEEDFESGSGEWFSEGWLLTDNVLPQTFLVQLVQPGNVEQPVTRLLDADQLGSGTWDVTIGGAAGDATLIVSGLAPVTTEPAQFSISATLVP